MLLPASRLPLAVLEVTSLWVWVASILSWSPALKPQVPSLLIAAAVCCASRVVFTHQVGGGQYYSCLIPVFVTFEVVDEVVQSLDVVVAHTRDFGIVVGDELVASITQDTKVFLILSVVFFGLFELLFGVFEFFDGFIDFYYLMLYYNA